MNQLLVIFSLALGLITTPLFLHAEPIDCMNLTGSYEAVADGMPSMDLSIQISYDAAANQLSLEYGHHGTGRYRTETYITDSMTHTGDDRWTGTTYSASCSPNQITLNKDYGPQYPKIVFKDTLTLKDGILEEFVEFADGSSSRITGRYRRK